MIIIIVQYFSSLHRFQFYVSLESDDRHLVASIVLSVQHERPVFIDLPTRSHC